MDRLRVAIAAMTERVIRYLPTTLARSGTGHLPITEQGQRGQGLAEYALILAGIAIVAIASLLFLGGQITDLFMAPINEEFGEVLSRLGI